MQLKRSGEFSWLLIQVKPFFRLHLGSYLCVVAASILVLLDPLIVRFLIDEVIPGRRISWLPLVAVAFFITYMGRLGFDSLALIPVLLRTLTIFTLVMTTMLILNYRLTIVVFADTGIHLRAAAVSRSLAPRL